jgi:AsmA protein
MQRLIVGALVVAAILAGGLALLPSLLPEDEVRRAVTRALLDATGAEPRISGDVRLSLFPRPVIRLDGIRLDDGRRGITSGSLSAAVRLAPLVTGSIEIGALTFERPRLTLELAPDGIRIAGLPLSPSPPSVARDNAPELRIVDGIVELRTAAGRVRTLTGVNASLAWAGAGLTASGTFDLDRLAVAATFVLADLGALRKGERSALRLRLDAENQRYTFEGGLAFRNGPQLEGALVADGRSLRAALASLGLEAPGRNGLGAYSLKTRVAFTPGSLALSALTVEVDGNLAEGGVTLKQEGGRAVVQGTLASELIDLTRYTASKPPRETLGWLREPINSAALRAVDLDLRLSARRVLIEKSELSTAALTLTLKSGRLAVALGEAQLFGGALRGSLALVPGPAGGANVKIDASLTDFNLDQALLALGGPRRLEGTGVLTLALHGTGANPEAVADDLAGTADLVISGGAITGINVEQVLRRLDRKPLSGFGDLRGGRTPFDRFVAKLRVADGNAALDEIQIESPLIQVSLTGSASFTRREFDLRGTAALVRPTALAAATAPRAFELPFLLRGPWDSPLLLPDADALISRSGAAQPLFDAVRPRGAVRSVIESLTGPRPAADQPAAAPPTAATPATVPR